MYPIFITGNFFVDDAVLKAKGISDFNGYAVDPNAELMPDFFV
jgi:citronellol/citronellal dehydrogenase